MATITLQSSFKIDYFSFFTVQQFKERYLAGIPLPSSISDSVLQFYLDASISELETLFDLKFKKLLL